MLSRDLAAGPARLPTATALAAAASAGGRGKLLQTILRLHGHLQRQVSWIKTLS